MENLICALGAPDPEMEAIEKILKFYDITVVYAMISGRRVSAAEAYRADGTSDGRPWSEVTHLIECGPKDLSMLRSDFVRIDHHHPGDPGFGGGPKDFFKSSSIGQVVGLFEGVPLPSEVYTAQELVLIAAADHCLGHAYAGRCPGVDPDELLRFRVAQKVAHRRPCPECGGTGSATGVGGLSGYEGPCHYGPVCSVETILKDIAEAKEALSKAPWVSLGIRSILISPGWDDDGEVSEHWYDVLARDMRGRHVPELPEAGTRYDIPYIADGLPGPDGLVKVVCSGNDEVISDFMLKWAPSQGLTGIYGDPMRGFAGGYRNS